jgi:hypothetical protein
MIPEFGSGGLLPPAPGDQGYRCTLSEVEKRFVLDIGSPDWRTELFRNWSGLRVAVGEMVLSAWWWLWGCFISNHREPLFGDLEVLSSLVILPVVDLPDINLITMVVHSLQAAESNFKVDASYVFEFPAGDENVIETMEALEFLYRPRVSRGIEDHESKVLVPAGFIEVGP